MAESDELSPLSADLNSNEEKTEPAEGRRFSLHQVIAFWIGGIVVCVLAATLLSMQGWILNSGADGSSGVITRAKEVGAGGLADGGYFVIVCLYVLVGAAAFSDAALRKVPNSFTYTALVLALILNLLIAPFVEFMGWDELSRWIGASSGEWGGVALESIKGFGLCFAVGIISFAARGLGGGDVKLLMALGALAGFSLTVSILLNTLAVAAVIGLINLFFQGKLIQQLQRFFFSLYLSLVSRSCVDPQSFGRTESPFCLSMFLAMILLPFVNIHGIATSGFGRVFG
ncbi:MAG: prepilin peptidase [Planctomycetota bacterium]|jgi:prepilin peptidase CpaA